MNTIEVKPLYRENYEGLARSIISHTRQIEKTILPTLELAYLRGKQFGEELEKKKHKKSQ